MEELRGDILCLKNENDKLRQELEAIKRREEKLRAEVDFAIHVSRDSCRDERSNFLEQYSRNYDNLRLLFMSEPERETQEECEEAVLKLFHDKLGLRQMKRADLDDVVHR